MNLITNYKIFEIVEQSRDSKLNLILDEDDYLYLLKELNINFKFIDTHDSIETAKQEIEKYSKELQYKNLTILPIFKMEL